MKDTIINYLQSRPTLFTQQAVLTAKQAADTVAYCKDQGVQYLYFALSKDTVFALFGGHIPWLSGVSINSVEEGVAIIKKQWPADESTVQASMHCLP